MRLRSQDYWCDVCDCRFVRVVEIAEDAEFSSTACPQTVKCEMCGWEDAYPVIGAPRVLKASLPDGTSRGDAWKLTREISDLRSKSFDLPPEKRGELNSEMDRLESVVKTKGLKDRFAP